MMLERTILGDNQFFGVNHMSEERARAQALQFQDVAAITAVLDAAYEEGIRAFMCTTHERVAEICSHMRSNLDRYTGFSLYPCMPYAHKYANAATERGVLGAIKSLLPDSGAVGALFKSGLAIARKDLLRFGPLLIDAEMKMFRGLSTPVIFLQSAATDLLLGLGMGDALQIFADHVRTRYHAEPGFITMNLPMLLDVLNRCGIDNPIICTSINKIGFRMSGGVKQYEEVIRTAHARIIAMSVFASGAIPPQEAIEYICRQGEISSIVFGASTRNHIAQTKRLIVQMDEMRALAAAGRGTSDEV